MSDKPHDVVPLRLNRRHLMAAGLVTAVLPVGTTQAADRAGPVFVYVGSYTKDPPGGGSNNPVGISVFKFNPADGELTPVQQVASANPSFVALDPSRRFPYVINEIDDYESKKTGSVEAFAIDSNTGMLTLLNRQSVGGPIPAHLAVDPSGRHLIVANYIGGNFVVLPIGAEGRLGPVSGELKDTGSGPNQARQEGPHPHAVVFDRAGRYIAAADLGIDKVQTFRLKELQTISTEPPGYGGPHSTAEIAVHPSGKFLYASNRGYNSIIGYRIDPETSLLSVIGHATKDVNFPRNFAIDPSGRWLYVANKKGDTIVQFEVNAGTGELKPTGRITASITPVAIVFRSAKRYFFATEGASVNLGQPAPVAGRELSSR